MRGRRYRHRAVHHHPQICRCLRDAVRRHGMRDNRNAVLGRRGEKNLVTGEHREGFRCTSWDEEARRWWWLKEPCLLWLQTRLLPPILAIESCAASRCAVRLN